MNALPDWMLALGDGPAPAPARQRTALPSMPVPPLPPGARVRIVVPDPEPPAGDDPFRMARPSAVEAPQRLATGGELAYVPAPLAARPPALRLEEGPGGRAERLEVLVDTALDVVDEILHLPLEPFDDNFPRVLGAKKDTALGVISLQMKADENAFKAKSADGLLGLLKVVLDKESTLIDITPTTPSS